MRALLAVALLCAAPLFAGADRPRDDEPLQSAADRFVEAIVRSAAAIRREPQYDGDRGRADGTAYWTRMLLRTIEAQILQDPDDPLFRVVDFRSREGGDNPDQRYLVAPIRGGERYRLWGTRGSHRRLEIQVYAGLPWSAEGGRVIAALGEESLRVEADGRFEILLDPERRTGNWLENPRGASMIMVRQIFADWDSELPGEVHIDRVGHEGRLKPAPTGADLAQRLLRAADELERIVVLWPRFVREQYTGRLPANTLSAPFDPAALGGVRNRWMAAGHFALEDDEALILTVWPGDADHFGVQLTDEWFSSLEYANRQTSLTAEQSWCAGDGSCRYVVAHRDPGVQNWLDTTGLARGVILLRYDGLREALSEARWPTLRRIRLADLRAELPTDTPAFDASQRRQAIEARRRHVQRRFGV